MNELISSKSNPLVKLARSLHTKKARDESDSFIVEGVHHVGEASQAGWEIQAILYCPERLKSEFGLGLIHDLHNRGVRCSPLTAEVFDSITEKDNPQGIIAIVNQKHRTITELNQFEFILAVVSPQDPGNIGTILRTIDAVDADGLILIDGGVEPYHPSVIRASMGSIFWKPFYSIDFNTFVSFTNNLGVRTIGTSAHGSLDYRKVKLDNRPTILLLGSEQKGLQPAQLGICESIISLPMKGRTSSLNLGVAAAIFLYALKG